MPSSPRAPRACASQARSAASPANRTSRQALPGHDPGPGFGPDRSAGQGRNRGRSDLALSPGLTPGAPLRTAEDDRHVSRLMLFFAIVYLVEGIGQARVGIIYQPLTHYLKETGWTALQVAAYFAVLNFPWVIKPVFGLVSDFLPLFGYRRKSYLIIASLCALGGYAVIARQADPAAFALPLLLTAYAMATASTLCGALLAENGQAFRLSSSFVSQQWLWFYIAIMACSFAGGALVEALPALAALQMAAAIAAVAPIAVVLASLLLLDERKVGTSGRELRRTFQSLVAATTSAKLYLVALFLFL